MLHPSYSDLMKVVNSEVEPGETLVVNSRYSIVMATAKRARQLIAGEDPMVDSSGGRKSLSVAIDELNQGKIKILTEEEVSILENASQVLEEAGETPEEEMIFPEETMIPEEDADGAE